MSFPADVPPADDHYHRALGTPQRPVKPVEGCADKQADASAPPLATSSAPAAASSSASARPAAAASTTAPRKKKAEQKPAPSNQELKPRPRQESEAAPGQGRTTREYKRRMPKQRATAWPSSILSDPDVLSLDDEGRFVLCKVCHVHYAVHGGKKPKPVIMNSIFRTRAWEVHKERTNSHRMQKRSAELAAKADLAATLPGQTHDSHQQQLQHEHQQQLSRLHQQQQRARQLLLHQRQHQPEATSRRDVSAQRQERPYLASSRDAPPRRHGPPRGAQELDSPPRASQPPAPLPSLQRRQSEGASSTVPALSRTPMLTNNIMSEQDLRRRVSGNERLFIRPGGLAAKHADSNNPTPVHSDAQGESHERSQEDWTSGSKSSSRDSQPNDQTQSGCASNEQTPGQPAERTAQPAPEAAEVTHTEAPSSSRQIERRSRKRKSWERDEGTDSSKEEETRDSPDHKARDQYWRTLREVYTTSRTKRGASDAAEKEKKKKKKKKRTMESTTASREATGVTESPLRTVVVHDPTLINAIDRLAGVLSKQLSEMRADESSTTRHFMSTLTTEVSEMRRCQEDAMERMLDLGERHLKVMEGILQCKLRKEQRISDVASARRRDAPPPSSSSSDEQQQQP